MIKLKNFRVCNLVLVLLLIIEIVIATIWDVIRAQVSQDNTAPVIVHLPVKTAMRGQPIPIIARVADDSQVGTVTVNFKKGGRFLDVPLPMVKTADSGVLKIKVLSEAAYVYSGPGSWNDTLATVIKDDVFDTFDDEQEHGFYHIQLSDEITAWLSFADAEPVITGSAYMGTIPASMTYESEVIYRIAAEDISNNKISTLPHTIHIISPEKATQEPENMAKKEFQPPPSKPSGPFYTKLWFWGGLVLVAGAGAGAALYLNQKDEDKKGSIQVNVEW